MEFIKIATTVTKEIVDTMPLKKGLRVVKHDSIRSAIYDENGELLVFSPLSGDSPDKYFDENFQVKSTVRVEEFVEGTMINLFHHNNEWTIATKNSVGGNNSFYIIGNTRQMSFRSMFDECCKDEGLDVNDLDKTFIYSFVMKHTNNRIINKPTSNMLYLVAAYKRPGHESSFPETIDMVRNLRDVMPVLGFGESSVLTPAIFNVDGNMSKKYVVDKFAQPYTCYSIMGVSLFDTETGTRSKYRNPAYEELKKLRGNQAKVEYHYISLRKEGRVDEFLDFFPEYAEDFKFFECKIQNFQQNLYQRYLRCYMKKEQPLKEFERNFKKHMYAIHSEYLTTKQPTQMNTVVKYTSSLPEAVLMSSMNQEFRMVATAN